jgi:hypothetical protein
MEKVTQRDLNLAVSKFGMMRFFSGDPAVQAAVMNELRSMCRSREALETLVSKLTAHCAEWPGMSEVRGLLCTFDAPADGVEVDCSIPGFRPCDYMQKAIEESDALAAGAYIEPTPEQIAAWRKELPGSDREFTRRLLDSAKPKGGQ